MCPFLHVGDQKEVLDISLPPSHLGSDKNPSRLGFGKRISWRAGPVKKKSLLAYLKMVPFLLPLLEEWGVFF